MERGPALEPGAHPPGRVLRRAHPPAHRRPARYRFNAQGTLAAGGRLAVHGRHQPGLRHPAGLRLRQRHLPAGHQLLRQLHLPGQELRLGQPQRHRRPAADLLPAQRPVLLHQLPRLHAEGHPAQLPGHLLPDAPGLVLPGRRRAAPASWATTSTWSPTSTAEPLQSTYTWQRRTASCAWPGAWGSGGRSAPTCRWAAASPTIRPPWAPRSSTTDNALNGSNLRARHQPQRRTPSSSTAPPRTGCWARPGCSSPPRPSAGSSRTCTLFGYSGEVKHVLDPYFALTDTSRSGAEG